MGTKTISIMDDVYELLVRHKRKDESFSDVIRKVFVRKKDIMRFAGAWKDISDEDTKKMKDFIKKMRKDSTKEFLRNIKRK